MANGDDHVKLALTKQDVDYIKKEFGEMKDEFKDVKATLRSLTGITTVVNDLQSKLNGMEKEFRTVAAHYADNAVKLKLPLEMNKIYKRLFKVVIIVMLLGSFIWIKESRDLIIKFIGF